MKYLFLLIAILLTQFVHAQSTEDSVKAVINKMFDAMRQGNATMLKECFADSAILQTIGKNGNIRTDDVAVFARQIATLPKNAADEQISFQSVLIDGPLASVWTPYRFYYNNNFSHCGINSFQLVRIDGNWKIQYLVDTRRKDNCN